MSPNRTNRTNRTGLTTTTTTETETPMSTDVQRFHAANDRLRDAKARFTNACVAVLKNQPEAQQLVTDAMAEIDRARAELKDLEAAA